MRDKLAILSSSSSLFLFVRGRGQDVNGSQLTLVRPKKQLTFFDNAKSSLSDPLFTVDLKKNAPGSYNFGFIDDSKYTGTITYVPVDSSRGFWEFTSEGYSVGSSRSFKSVSIEAIADTGTTLLYLPDAVVQDYYGAVPSASYSSSQGGYIFPCDASLPSISLGIGTYRAVIPGPFMNYAPIDKTGSGMFFLLLSPGSTSFTNIISRFSHIEHAKERLLIFPLWHIKECFGGIQSNAGIGFSIFGDIFLKSQFAVFSAGDNRPSLGFAAKPL